MANGKKLDADVAKAKAETAAEEKAAKAKVPALPASADYADVFPFVQAAFGFDDIIKAASWYAQHKESLDSIFQFFKGLLKHKNNPKTEPAPAPVVVTPVVVVPPAPSPVDGPLPYPGRIVSRLVAKPYWIGKQDNPYHKDEFDRVVSGDDPLAADGHTKLHVDITPLDQAGVEIGPGSPELAQLLRSDGHPAIVHHCTLDGNEALADGRILIGSVDDDYGCTPSLKPSADVRDDKDHRMVYWASFANEGSPGRAPNSPVVTIASNQLVFRVK